MMPPQYASKRDRKPHTRSRTYRVAFFSLSALLIASVVVFSGLAKGPGRGRFTAVSAGAVVRSPAGESPQAASYPKSLMVMSPAAQACQTSSVTVAPGASPAGGYLPLSLFGIPPVAGVTDDSINNFNVPAFLYAGQLYTRVGFSSNGYVVIGGSDAAGDNTSVNQSLPDSAAPNNVLAPFWTNLDPSASGTLRIGTLTDGSDIWLVLDWQNVREASSTKVYSFQIWIGTNSDANPGEDISFAYGPMGGNGNGGLATVGAENSTGDLGQNVYYNGTGALPANGTQLRVTTTNHVRAKCKNISVTASDSCSYVLNPSEVDNGSQGPTPSDSVTLSVDQPLLTGAGAHVVNLTATSGSESCSCEATVTVVDATEPVITLNGDNPLTISYRQTFTDPGATATDSCEGNLTGAIVRTGSVNNTVVGSYTLTYTVSDAAGNKDVVTRTVIVAPSPPANKDSCKDTAWQFRTTAAGKPFPNQGQCVSYFNTGK